MPDDPRVNPRAGSKQSGCGGIGSHTCLKSRRRKACGFESHHPDQCSFTDCQFCVDRIHARVDKDNITSAKVMPGNPQPWQRN